MELNFTANVAKQATQPAGPTAWRSGNRLVIDSRRPILPDHCPVTGVVTDLEEAEIPIKHLPIGQFWHRLALYLSTGVLGAGLLENRFGEVLKLRGAVTSQVIDRRARRATVGWWLLWIGVLLAMIALFVIFKGPAHDPVHQFTMSFSFIVGAAGSFLLGILALWSGNGNLLRYLETHEHLVFLGGAHPDFLATLPDYSGRPAEFAGPLKRSASYGGLAHLTGALGGAILLAEVALFFCSQGLPEDVGRGLRGLAFWGGLAGVHLVVLAGFLFVWFSQRSLEWRLGMAAGVPLLLLLLIGAGQDFLLIKGANQAARQEVAKVKRQNASGKSGKSGKKQSPAKTGTKQPSGNQLPPVPAVIPRPPSRERLQEMFKPLEVPKQAVPDEVVTPEVRKQDPDEVPAPEIKLELP